MAFAPLRSIGFIRKTVHNACFTTLLKRPLAYKSAISLETLYPNSSLKITTPSFTTNAEEKFSGFIPLNKLDVTYSASSGPGGQNVNKVHTKVDLRFKVAEADWIHPDVRAKMMELHGNKLTKEGYLVLRSDATRTRQLNVADCLAKLRQLLREAAQEKKEACPETVERHRQKQLKAARLRLTEKREAAARRALRQPPSVLDL